MLKCPAEEIPIPRKSVTVNASAERIPALTKNLRRFVVLFIVFYLTAVFLRTKYPGSSENQSSIKTFSDKFSGFGEILSSFLFRRISAKSSTAIRFSPAAWLAANSLSGVKIN